MIALAILTSQSSQAMIPIMTELPLISDAYVDVCTGSLQHAIAKNTNETEWVAGGALDYALSNGPSFAIVNTDTYDASDLQFSLVESVAILARIVGT
ncbi:Hypothetical protein MVR_LOCUS45 [uncultured virus]|nr:Hypothetical protein MVR_LOCUS45 [uncultured virus]